MNRKISERNPNAPPDLIQLEVQPEWDRNQTGYSEEMARAFGWDPENKYWVNPTTKITIQLNHPVPAAEATRYTAALATSRYYIVGSNVLIGPLGGYPPRRPWEKVIDWFEEVLRVK